MWYMSEEIVVKWVKDVAVFGGVSAQLGNLSRYADNAAGAALAGDIKAAELAGFVAAVRDYYEQLRNEVLEVVDDEYVGSVAMGMAEIPDTADIFVVSLVLDQTISWLTANLLPNHFERNLRMSAMKMSIEESMTKEELGSRSDHMRRSGGLYA